MYPDRKTAEALLTEAEPHNPGPWASPRPTSKPLPSFCIGGIISCASPASSFSTSTALSSTWRKSASPSRLWTLCAAYSKTASCWPSPPGVPRLIVPRFDGVEFDVFLTYNGSYCYDRRGDIFASPIPPQDVQTLIQNAAALGRPVSVAGRTQLLSNGTDDDLTAYYAIGGRAPVISDKFDEVSRRVKSSSC